MSRYDDYDGPDGSEDTDPEIRELRAEIVRLEARLDQLSAGVRERAAELAVTQAQVEELKRHVGRLEARRRRDLAVLRATWVMLVLSVVLSLYAHLAL